MCSQTRNSCATAFDNRSRSKILKPKKSRGCQFAPPSPSRLLGLRENKFSIPSTSRLDCCSTSPTTLDASQTYVPLSPRVTAVMFREIRTVVLLSSALLETLTRPSLVLVIICPFFFHRTKGIGYPRTTQVKIAGTLFLLV